MDELTKKNFKYILDLLEKSKEELVNTETEDIKVLIGNDYKVRTSPSLDSAIKFISEYILE